MSILCETYTQRYHDVLLPTARELEGYLKNIFDDTSRIDKICVRAKNIRSFMLKANKHENGTAKYSDPLNQIQDQIGARIVTFYLSDVNKIAEIVSKEFRHIEERTVVPDSDSEFSYFGKHYILLLPVDVTAKLELKNLNFFELQIKTLFQHAWSEANHDLGYKGGTEISPEVKRKIAFASAQAWGADHIFNDLFNDVFGCQ